MHWCEVVTRKTIDCGAHAALADEALGARGMTSFPARFVQNYSQPSLDAVGDATRLIPLFYDHDG